jgi:hypothetical protein
MGNLLDAPRLLVVLDVLAWLFFFTASGRYIKYASALTDFIDTHCPQLWQQLMYGRRFMRPRAWSAARGLDRLILFNVGAQERSDDPDFRALLARARWSAGACAFFFVSALILLSQLGDGFACRSFRPAGSERFCTKFDSSRP